MRVPPPEQYDADYWFSSESKEISDELKAKIDFIKSEGQIGVLAEAVTYLLAKIKETQPELIDKLKPAIRNQKLLEPKVVLSPIVVDEHYKLFLPGFGNVEIRLHALPKTLYLFYLNHPEGIRLPELYEHKRELLSIYNKLTNKYSNEEIEKAIDDLVDMTNPSVNQKCSRIRAAFREIMDEDIAKHYYIDGPMGEAKKISLPADLIDIRF
jgi:hypothetical protein